MANSGSSAKIEPQTEVLTTTLGMLTKLKPQMKAALPKHLNPDRMLRIVTTTLRRTPRLLECTPISLAGAVIQACQLGLEPDGFLGEFYLTPRRIHGVWTIVGIPGYRGLAKLARQSGEVDWIVPHCVYQGDEFTYEYGSDPKLIHRPGDRSREDKNITAAYAVARLRSGSSLFWVMGRPEIDKVRDTYASARDDGPWITHYPDMAAKTPMRRLCKFLPQSPALGRAVALDEQAEAGLPQGLDALVDPSDLGLVGSRTTLDKIGEALEKKSNGALSDTTPAVPAGPVGSEGPADSHAPAWATPPPVADPPAAAPATPPPQPIPSPILTPPPIPSPKPPRVRKPRQTKWPQGMEVPVGPPAPAPEPAVSPTGELEVTATTLFSLIGGCQTDEGLEEVSERIKASPIFTGASEGQKAVIRAAIIKQRATFSQPPAA